jgi:dipeptidyl-peptidase-4
MTTRRLLILAAALTACRTAQPMSWPQINRELLADAGATFNFRLGLPAALAITRDGAVLFRRTPPRDFAADLYELDPKTGAVKTLATASDLLGTGTEHLSDAEKARRERSRTATRGVVDVDVSDDGHTVMVPLGGKLYLIDRATGSRRVVDPQGPMYDPHLSPDGRTIAFVRDGDLWLVVDGAPRRLTKHPEGLEYGVAEFVAQEELGRRRGFWWSPDSQQICFQRTDSRSVETVFVSDPRHPERPSVPFKYPRPGKPNAKVDLGIVAAGGGEPRWVQWDLARYGYLVEVVWPKRGALTALVVNREQTDLALLAVDPAAGSTKALLTEHDDAWLNTSSGVPKWLEDGSGFLWMTEARGAWTLELHAPDGSLVRPLTAPELGLRRLVGVGKEGAVVEASAEAPAQAVWRVPLAGGAPQALTPLEGVATAESEYDVVVVQAQLHAGGHQSYALAGGARHELPSAAERPKLTPTTKIETVELEGRKHFVAITRPRDFDPSRGYPVILKVYGGPHATMVLDALDAYVMDQVYADAGFVVVRSDGRGTPNRGRDWERATLRDLISIPMADQIGALQAMGARHRDLDLSRVGIAGWSFGGYFSLMAALLHPEVFKAAIAGAPVTDWTFYDTAYTERYMKTPQENPEGYRLTSALTHAAKLDRPLLVIHGITDDNVHLENTLALLESLYLAGKRAEVITLSATHMVPDPKLNVAREQVQIDFFRQHLGPP